MDAPASFDHLVGAGEERGWDFEAESLCRHCIDHEFKRSRLLDRQLTRLGAAQDFIHVIGGPAKKDWVAWSIGHQTSSVDVLPRSVHHRQAGTERQNVDAMPVCNCEQVLSDIE